MGNAYDTMASIYAPGKTMAYVALGSATASCVMFPELLLLLPTEKDGILLKTLSRIGSMVKLRAVTIGKDHERMTSLPLTNVPIRIGLMITDTGELLKACSAIHESAVVARQARNDVKAQLGRITEQNWNGEDQRAYVEKVKKYLQRVDSSAVLCEITAGLTAALGTLIFLQITIAMALSVALAAITVAMLALLWFPPALPPLRSAGSAIARTLRTVILRMDNAMNQIGMAFAGIVTGMVLSVGIAESIIAGNAQALTDMGESFVNTLSDLLKKYSFGLAHPPSDVGTADKDEKPGRDGGQPAGGPRRPAEI